MNTNRREYFAERAAQMAALRPMLTYEEIGRLFGIGGGRVFKTLIVHGHLTSLKVCVVCGIEFSRWRHHSWTCSSVQCRAERQCDIWRRASLKQHRKHPWKIHNRNRRIRQERNDAIRLLRGAGLLEGMRTHTSKDRDHIYKAARELGLV